MVGIESLRTTLEVTWRCVQARALSRELSPELMAVVVRLVPQAATEILSLCEPGSFSAAYLLRDHAPALWRATPAQFLERLRASAGQVPLVPTIARVVDALQAHEDRAPLERVVADAWATLDEPRARILALLAWSRHAERARSEALVREAQALVAEHPAHLAEAIARWPDAAWAEHAAALGALVEAEADVSRAAEARLALLPRLPLEARRAHVDRLFGAPLEASRALYAMSPHVPFAWVEAHVLDELERKTSPRALRFASAQLAPHASPRVLDALWSRATSLPLWATAEVWGHVARHHGARSAAMRPELARVFEQLVGDGRGAHGLSGEDVPIGAHPGVLRASPALTVSDALDLPTRASLQARALRLLGDVLRDAASDPRASSPIDWRAVGRGLVPSLRAEAMRVAVAAEPRDAALEAAGALAVAYPPAEQHLALVALSRLADRTHVPGRASALAALRSSGDPRGRTPTTDSVANVTADGDGPFGELSSASDLSMGIDELSKSPSIFSVLDGLHRAAREADPRRRLSMLLALAASPALATRPERVRVVADALELMAASEPIHDQPARLAAAMAGLALTPLEPWCTRLALLFTRGGLDERGFLRLVEGLAPALVQLGGATWCATVADVLEAPSPEPEFAKAWAGAGTRVALA